MALPRKGKYNRYLWMEEGVWTGKGGKTGIRREEGGKGGTFKTKGHLRGCVET